MTPALFMCEVRPARAADTILRMSTKAAFYEVVAERKSKQHQHAECSTRANIGATTKAPTTYDHHCCCCKPCCRHHATNHRHEPNAAENAVPRGRNRATNADQQTDRLTTNHHATGPRPL